MSDDVFLFPRDAHDVRDASRCATPGEGRRRRRGSPGGASPSSRSEISIGISLEVLEISSEIYRFLMISFGILG